LLDGGADRIEELPSEPKNLAEREALRPRTGLIIVPDEAGIGREAGGAEETLRSELMEAVSLR